MPGRPPTPGKKFVYLDWSSFGEAFDGFALDANVPQRGLNRLVYALSAETNLCFSFTHIWELAHLEDATKRDAFARWLDELDLVWIHSDDEVERREVKHAVLDAIHGQKTRPPIPTATSFLSMLHPSDWDQDALAYGLQHSTLAEFVEMLASTPRLMEHLNRFRELSVQSAKVYYDDRKRALSEVTKEEMLASLDRKVRARFEEDALRIAALLRRDPESDFHVQRSGIYVSPSDEDVVAALSGAPDLTMLPYIFLTHRVLRNMSFDILRRPSKSSRKFDEQRGDLYDIAHLVGAAYCDVFTCDTRVSRRLRGGRELLGFRAPISGSADIVTRLIAQQLGT